MLPITRKSNESLIQMMLLAQNMLDNLRSGKEIWHMTFPRKRSSVEPDIVLQGGLDAGMELFRRQREVEKKKFMATRSDRIIARYQSGELRG